MKNRASLVAPVTLAILFLLMAWDNAIAMAVVSAIGSVVVAIIVLRRHPRRGVTVTFMLISFATAAVVAFLLSRTQ